MAKAKTPKPKTCKICQSEFTPRSTTHTVCSLECTIELSNRNIQRKEERELRRQRSIERQELKARREKLKSQSDWEKEAQAAFNKYIRARDYRRECVSCGCKLVGSSNYLTGSAIDASHYRSRGAASHLRFNVFNVHSSCTRCNRQLSGNAVEYRIRLIKRIGLGRVEALESNNKTRKFNIDYLKRVKQIFTRRARYYEKRRKREYMEAA
ncbi:recombination protein NinG [Xenorhabdus sp. XENO-10]|uniref:Recombination protein NinG n=1 Tax=Xenorhabdus yunnanensis TaxID=3025878 RepID=A0ABT5LML9_9GAMM|nr:recombination protein NinG [Xenorhabdus yunnanensis]MDC9591733.1 recombination protein NinG [Xenorhabdus yunnanensis]